MPSKLTDDSDSDGPIQYRDDPNPPINMDENEEEVPICGSLASKVYRRDTLACKLEAPPCKDDIDGQTAEERKQLMHKASIKLARCYL